MASTFPLTESAPARRGSALSDPARALASPVLDALLFWGAPVLALGIVLLWVIVSAHLPQPYDGRAILALVGINAVITYAHLIAVAPRAYLNREVFAAYRTRLTIAPVLLTAALLLSPALLVCAAVLAIFWDVHHSAMQTFGLGRIYDMKAGNDGRALRRVDLALNWALYVGPLAAGAALAVHVAHFGDFARVGWLGLATLPQVASGWTGAIHRLALGAWGATMLLAVFEYARAARTGYRMPAHKAALLGLTALVSLVAWLLTPPFVALAIVNLFHAIQYFAIIWLKEGARMRTLARGKPVTGAAALLGFLLLCALFGLAYHAAASARVLLAPFIACSLLHFWYDGFVWSVRKRQV